jgi:hypothetical protein
MYDEQVKQDFYRLPDREQHMVCLLRGILSGDITVSEQLRHAYVVDPILYDTFVLLLRVYLEDGEDVFWHIYNAHMNIFEQFPRWKPMLEPDEEVEELELGEAEEKIANVEPSEEEKNMGLQQKRVDTLGPQRRQPDTQTSTSQLATEDAQQDEAGLDDLKLRAGVFMSKIQSERVGWLWQNRLPLGTITMLEGDPGLGKSLVTLDLAARVSRGDPMPDGAPGMHGNVILIHPEDSASMTIKPRLESLGANMKRIVSLNTITNNKGYTRPIEFPRDLEFVKITLKALDACLLIIDPLMAVLQQQDVYRDNAVRQTMQPLLELVEEMHIACILVRHLNKGSGDKAIYRGGGSIAFTALARSVISVQVDPADREKRVLAGVKSNLGPMARSLLFSIESDDADEQQPHLLWHGECGYEANELYRLNDSPARNQGGAREEILHVLKEAYPEAMKLDQIGKELPEISEKTLFRTLQRMLDAKLVERVERATYRAVGY